jgi:hypothetical protein
MRGDVMQQPTSETFVVPTVGREPSLAPVVDSPSDSDAVRVRRAYWATAPAGTIRVGVDSGPVSESTALEVLAAGIRQPLDESQPVAVASESVSIHGVDGLQVRTEWEENGISWRAVDLVWIADGLAWRTWATAPSSLADSGAVALEEIVLQHAEGLARSPEPSAARWGAAVEAWRKVKL